VPLRIEREKISAGVDEKTLGSEMHKHGGYNLQILLGFLIVLLTPATLCQAQSDSVGVVETLTVHDNSRQRDVPLKIYYPRSAAPADKFPVILFSHGAGGSKDGYGYVGQFRASHGYVCIHLDHLGSDHALVQPGRLLLTLRAIKDAVQDPDNLINRPLDVSFVIDSLPKIEMLVPELTGHLDTNRVGVSGHSFGAYTTMAVAGARIHLPNNQARTFQDQRVSAFLAMTPQGVGSIGFGEDSWGSIHQPFLTMSGTEDRELSGGPASERLQAFNHMPPGRKFHILIEGATHMDFDDRQFSGQPVAEKYHKFIQEVSLAFWDTYLRQGKTETEAFPDALKIHGILTGNNLLSEAGLQATLQTK
jgi:predicted dienelactone hydrolase